MTNGPVIGGMTPNTDFLTYKDGVYQRTQEAFKFQGSHLVKIVGWETLPDNGAAWIVENQWGEDWGENGFAKIAMGQGDSTLDYYSLSVSVYPVTMAEYYASEISREETLDTWSNDLSQKIMDGLNEEEFDPDLIEEIDLDSYADEF